MDMPSGSTDGGNSSTLMPMSGMAMTFFTSPATPLYSLTWSPTSQGSYAGTCIFLVLLGVLMYILLVVRAWKEHAWLDAEFKRRYVVVQGKPTKKEEIVSDRDSKTMLLTENGVEEEVIVVQKTTAVVRPWRLSVDPLRAILNTLIAGVGYLLMLAVMTMNIGYFLSVLGGHLLGSLLFGRFIVGLEHGH